MRAPRRHDNSALIVGRFQPFHKGHLQIIKIIMEQSDQVTIGIGSAQYSHTLENPFTAGERHLMISESLRDEGLESFFIVPVEDINRYSAWVTHVVSIVPPFTKVFSNNALTKRLFKEAGYEVMAAPMYNRQLYSGTEVRRRMIEGGDWESLVPESVCQVIEEIDGVNRIRDLSGRD
ncbi:MAG: nicotinamide-nucleotide adenylyltransferase [Candidatus Methanomethylophilaceae archaeon]|jgi:nicotinamide-nucleotide adenylyltransferase